VICPWQSKVKEAAKDDTGDRGEGNNDLTGRCSNRRMMPFKKSDPRPEKTKVVTMDELNAIVLRRQE